MALDLVGWSTTDETALRLASLCRSEEKSHGKIRDQYLSVLERQQQQQQQPDL